MIKMGLLEKYGYDDVLELCRDGIAKNPDLKNKVLNERKKLLESGDNYKISAEKSQLFSFNEIEIVKGQDPGVIGELTKSDFERLYRQYFLKKGKPAKDVYDAIINSAKDDCPFCGGIGTPDSLDHFLPKSKFPQFCVLPFNLVPACSSCNTVKRDSYARKKEDQIIHPYFDSAHFFNEQWVFADYSPGNDDSPGFFEYYVKPPKGWSKVDKIELINIFQTLI